jgi:hypothetical protein
MLTPQNNKQKTSFNNLLKAHRKRGGEERAADILGINDSWLLVFFQHSRSQLFPFLCFIWIEPFLLPAPRANIYLRDVQTYNNNHA